MDSHTVRKEIMREVSANTWLGEEMIQERCSDRVVRRIVDGRNLN
jgi:hypothetical protein